MRMAALQMNLPIMLLSKDFSSTRMNGIATYCSNERQRKMIVHLDEWFCYHIEDGHCELNKPVFTEFDLSNLNKDFQPSQQGRFYKTILDIKCKSEKRKQAGAGALIWQLFV
ncbi:hypothetical protein NC653_041736 [Populus alba x Populus x berolinensis]|uniref:Uncharacterized protein n=1 Tax=Populus alba x Populus x berolinensis TaxID=444605 RepID=A0AAD6L990_9ROSI|nr:hypothetical protein NC653_041736 [Populus alba x Populus x berolinensis]